MRQRRATATAEDGREASCRGQVVANDQGFASQPCESLRRAVQIRGVPRSRCLAAATAMTVCEAQEWRTNLEGDAAAEATSGEYLGFVHGVDDRAAGRRGLRREAGGGSHSPKTARASCSLILLASSTTVRGTHSLNGTACVAWRPDEVCSSRTRAICSGKKRIDLPAFRMCPPAASDGLTDDGFDEAGDAAFGRHQNDAALAHHSHGLFSGQSSAGDVVHRASRQAAGLAAAPTGAAAGHR